MVKTHVEVEEIENAESKITVVEEFEIILEWNNGVVSISISSKYDWINYINNVSSFRNRCLWANCQEEQNWETRKAQRYYIIIGIN